MLDEYLDMEAGVRRSIEAAKVAVDTACAELDAPDRPVLERTSSQIKLALQDLGGVIPSPMTAGPFPPMDPELPRKVLERLYRVTQWANEIRAALPQPRLSREVESVLQERRQREAASEERQALLAKLGNAHRAFIDCSWHEWCLAPGNPCRLRGPERRGELAPGWSADTYASAWVNAGWSPAAQAVVELGLSEPEVEALLEHAPTAKDPEKRENERIAAVLFRRLLSGEASASTTASELATVLAANRSSVRQFHGFFEGAAARIGDAARRLEKGESLAPTPNQRMAGEARTVVLQGGSADRSSGHRMLRGWSEICGALQVPNTKNRQRQLRRLNERGAGPIVWVSRRPEVDEGKLGAWISDVEARARAANQRQRSRDAATHELTERGGIRQADYKFHEEKSPNARGKARPARP